MLSSVGGPRTGDLLHGEPTARRRARCTLPSGISSTMAADMERVDDATPRSAPPVEPKKRRDHLELIATIALAIAAVGTAWSGYQASRWNGQQAEAVSSANAARIAAVTASGQADTETQVDIATFIQWVDARASGRPALARFYEQRFRPEFEPAFDAWVATSRSET